MKAPAFWWSLAGAGGALFLVGLAFVLSLVARGLYASW